MNKQQGHMLTALACTRAFLGDHATVLSAVITPAVRQKLDDALAELASTATAQDRSTRDRKGAFARQEALRTALVRDHMTPIARIARLELAHLPELVKFARSAPRLSIPQLAAGAEGMAEAARPHAQVFIEAGRHPDFADRLRHAADRLRAAAADAAQSRVWIRAATAGLAQQLSRSRTLVQFLDALVKEAAGDDAALVDGWNVAKRVVRVRRATSVPTRVDSIPAVAAPTLVITAAAGAVWPSSRTENSLAVRADSNAKWIGQRLPALAGSHFGTPRTGAMLREHSELAPPGGGTSAHSAQCAAALRPLRGSST